MWQPISTISVASCPEIMFNMPLFILFFERYFELAKQMENTFRLHTSSIIASADFSRLRTKIQKNVIEIMSFEFENNPMKIFSNYIFNMKVLHLV